MRYALYIVGFTFAQVVATGACVAYVLSHFDHGTRGETIVVAGPAETKVEAKKVEPRKTSIGELVTATERPLLPADWKTGTPVAVGRATCTPAIGPDGEQIVIVEFRDRHMNDDLAELLASMGADGWKSSTPSGTTLNRTGPGHRSAVVDHVWNRNYPTFVVAKAYDETAARNVAHRVTKLAR